MTLEQSGANEDMQALTPAVEVSSPLDEAVLAQEAIMIKQTSNGDKDALIELYENYVDQVYRYFYSQIRNIAETQDLTTETFTRAIELLMNEQHSIQGKPISVWLLTIANAIFQERNLRLSSVSLLENMNDLLEPAELIVENADVSETRVQREERAVLWDFVKKLPVAEQQVLIMRHVYSLPYSEIARRLKRGEHACKQLHYRALAKLRQLIQNSD
jgi:RNA polymerase sigma-70 factor, ECF subfamily